MSRINFCFISYISIFRSVLHFWLINLNGFYIYIICNNNIRKSEINKVFLNMILKWMYFCYKNIEIYLDISLNI